MLENDNSQACGACLWSQISGGRSRRIRHLRFPQLHSEFRAISYIVHGHPQLHEFSHPQLDNEFKAILSYISESSGSFSATCKFKGSMSYRANRKESQLSDGVLA